MENKLSKIRVGVLGGGQLARMLALKGHELGLKVHVLSFSGPGCAAAEVTPHLLVGKPTSPRDFKKFLSQVDLALFENEFLNLRLLAQAGAKTRTPFCPLPQVMLLMQDRLNQKKLLSRHQIPTAPYMAVDSLKQVDALGGLFPEGMVLKKRLQGYDGQGTFVSTNILKDRAAGQFIKSHSPLIAEKYVPFKKELALTLIRNKNKQMVHTPLVQTHQEKACCVWVKGPVKHKNLPPLLQKLNKMLDSIHYTGAIAFELFETREGNLLVNELAPRVHNSAHYSLEALSEDQFTLHLKAALNLPLYPPTVLGPGFAMLNLLGLKTPASGRPWLSHLPAGVKLHWYGKHPSRPGRKMGHLSCQSSSPQKALKTLLDFKNLMVESTPTKKEPAS